MIIHSYIIKGLTIFCSFLFAVPLLFSGCKHNTNAAKESTHNGITNNSYSYSNEQDKEIYHYDIDPDDTVLNYTLDLLIDADNDTFLFPAASWKIDNSASVRSTLCVDRLPDQPEYDPTVWVQLEGDYLLVPHFQFSDGFSGVVMWADTLFETDPETKAYSLLETLESTLGAPIISTTEEDGADNTYTMDSYIWPRSADTYQTVMGLTVCKQDHVFEYRLSIHYIPK